MAWLSLIYQMLIFSAYSCKRLIYLPNSQVGIPGSNKTWHTKYSNKTVKMYWKANQESTTKLKVGPQATNTIPYRMNSSDFLTPVPNGIATSSKPSWRLTVWGPIISQRKSYSTAQGPQSKTPTWCPIRGHCFKVKSWSMPILYPSMEWMETTRVYLLIFLNFSFSKSSDST